MLNKSLVVPNKADRWWSIVIGLGLAITPIHNKWLTDLLTNSRGETMLFLPQVGVLLWIMAAPLYIIQKGNWEYFRDWHNWGGRVVVIPLLILVAGIGLSGLLITGNLMQRIAPILMAVMMFTTYLAARKIGPSIFRMLVPFVLLGAAISVGLELVNQGGTLSGGLITNGCASAGFLIFGALVNRGKWQWLLCLTAAVGVLFIGALEGVLIAGVVFAVVLMRLDVNNKLLVLVWAIMGLATIWAMLGYLTPLYTENPNISTLLGIVTGKLPITTETLDALTTGRWTINLDALRNMSWLGEGFALTATATTAHNTPLVVAQQVGILPAVAYSFVTIYCLVKTKWKYIWIAVLAMFFWDHYVWTQWAPIWWVLVGVTLGTKIESDLIFRVKKEEGA